jgi:flagellar biosynthesis protein FliR
MNPLIQQIAGEAITALTMRQVVEVAMLNFYSFTLVLVRMSGLMIIGPIFGQRFIPTNIRVILVFTLALIITPALSGHAQLAFHYLDVDQDQQLFLNEVPEHLHDQFLQMLSNHGRTNEMSLSIHEYSYLLKIPQTTFEYVRVAVGELSLGLFLGFGVFVFLTGLQLSGEIIDQQTGLSLGEISNPGLEINSSITGQFLFLAGTAVFLLIKPIGGHLMMLSALVESFQVLPVGEAFVSSSSLDLLRDLVHQSLVLGVQIAAPILAIMSLVALTMGFLGHTVPQINVLVIGFPVRVFVSLSILGLVFTGMGDVLTDMVPQIIDGLRNSILNI